jgi:outer membrane autotransporter protein
LQQASPRGLAALTTLPLANAVATTAALRSHLGGIRALRPTPVSTAPASLNSSAAAASSTAPAPAASTTPATNTWLSIAGTQTDNGTSSDSPAYDTDAYSAHIGIDHAITDSFLLGLALTGHHARADIHANGGRIKQDEFRATLYGTVTPASFLYFDGTLSAGFSSFDTTRRVTGNFTPDAPDLTTVRTYTSDTDGIDYVATLTAGTNLNLSENARHRLALHPWLGVEFAHARADAFVERSGGAYAGAYRLDSQTQDSLLLRVGATLEYQTRVASKPLRLALTLSYGRELLDSEVDLRASFLGYSQNTRFEQTAATTPEDILQITPQVEFQFTRALSVQLSYTFDSDFADRTAHHLSAGVNWRF